MYLVDHLHQRGIGVILDWVPSHFPTDEHGLARFDGTHLYEHADPRQGFHPEWSSSISSYGRAEVRNFLASSALFWLDTYYIDALRVDAVASMLLASGLRAAQQANGSPTPSAAARISTRWSLSDAQSAAYHDHPDTQTIAEESTPLPDGVPPDLPRRSGGFGLKWNMGWMHDTLKYFQRD